MRILFLQKRLLFPHNTGGKIRTLNVLRHLAKWHDVTYVSNLLAEEKLYLEEMRDLGVTMKTVPWVEAPRRSVRFATSALLNLLTPFPLNVDKDFDPRLRQLVESEADTRNYDLLICDFVQMARNCLGIRMPKLLFQHNVEAEVFARLADRNTGLFRQYLRLQARRMRRFEGEAGRDFDGVVAVSERDRQQYEENYRWKHVVVIDTAVDTQYFRPPPAETSRRGIVFVGSMDWPPNVDGMLHFIANIWPSIRTQIPSAELTIVGRNPPAAIKQQDRQNGITVTGTVDDIRPYLASAAIAVVPLYSGGGTRLKIFEYMAMGCPVVSTTLGAEGLDIQNDVHLLIRDFDEDFSSAASQLLRTPQHQAKIASAALKIVRERFSAEPVARQFESYCLQAVKAWKAAQS